MVPFSNKKSTTPHAGLDVDPDYFKRRMSALRRALCGAMETQSLFATSNPKNPIPQKKEASQNGLYGSTASRTH